MRSQPSGASSAHTGSKAARTAKLLTHTARRVHEIVDRHADYHRERERFDGPERHAGELQPTEGDDNRACDRVECREGDKHVAHNCKDGHKAEERREDEGARHAVEEHEERGVDLPRATRWPRLLQRREVTAGVDILHPARPRVDVFAHRVWHAQHLP
eukprot:3048717-Prymnesium_polylepis.2